MLLVVQWQLWPSVLAADALFRGFIGGVRGFLMVESVASAGTAGQVTY
jgi:hypothetical protein